MSAPVTARATCLINGLQTLVVDVEAETSASTEVVADAELQIRPCENHLFELIIMFFTHNPFHPVVAGQQSGEPLTLVPPFHKGTLQLLDISGEVMESFNLGPLLPNPIVVAKLLKVYPQRFKFIVEAVDTPPLHPADEELAQQCECILRSDSFPCSYTSSHVQNQLRESNSYTKVVGPVYASWHDFINAHPDKWTVFRYTPQEIRQHNISATARSKEFRIVSNAFIGEYVEGDKRKDRERSQAESRLVDVLQRTLRERDYEQQELLEILLQEPSFTTIMTPNVTKLVNFALRHPDTFWVVRDPLHSLRIGLRKDTPPTRPGEIGFMELSLDDYKNDKLSDA